MNNAIYAVSVEGKPIIYCDTISDAIAQAKRAVYAGAKDTKRAVDVLKDGMAAGWCYGFMSVSIYPTAKQNH